MAPTAGELITEQLDHDDGRFVTVFRPHEPAEAIVFAADGGWHVPRLAGVLGSASAPPIMIVGVHGLPDDDDRLKEYVPGFDARRFTAHERFFVGDVGRWVAERFGVAVPAARTAVWGASLGAELALAMGLRHPDGQRDPLGRRPARRTRGRRHGAARRRPRWRVLDRGVPAHGHLGVRDLESMH